jgi:IS5 family transposase
MDAQLSFASLDFAGKKKRTKREVFLAEMAAAVPWSSLEAIIEPHYPKVGPQGGRRPFPIGVMLRIYCLQQWYALSDPGAEEALYDIQSMRAFCHLELGRDPIPDETTILNFRHLLEAHALTKAVFEAVAEHLQARGALLRGGTIVDATLIAASPSTKNAAGQRDPEMRSSKKGNQWHFGMKAHIGVDASSGLVHTTGVTSGSVHDATVMDRLIRADDTAVYGDKGYASASKKRAAEAAGVLWAVKEKAQPGRPLTARQRARNRRFGKVCAKVEHVFRVLKCQFGYRKVRYRGLAKNAAQLFSLLALANLYLARRTLASA